MQEIYGFVSVILVFMLPFLLSIIGEIIIVFLFEIYLYINLII